MRVDVIYVDNATEYRVLGVTVLRRVDYGVWCVWYLFGIEIIRTVQRMGGGN